MPVIKRGRKYQARVNWTDQNGAHKTKQVSCNTKLEARNMEHKLLKELDILAENKRLRFCDIVEEFLAQKKNELKITSYVKLEEHIQRELIPYFGNVDMSKITVRDIEKWKRTIYKRGWLSCYANKYYNKLCMIWNYAIKYYGLPINPVAIAGNFRNANEQETQFETMTYDEYLLVDDKMKELAISDYQKGMRIAINIMLLCGLRKGECNALRWNRYHKTDDGAYLEIKSSINEKVKGGYIESTPKTKRSNGIVTCPKRLICLLDEWYTACQEFYTFNNEFFIAGIDSPIPDTTLSNFFNNVTEIAIGKHLRIHDLRHSQASILLNMGVPIELVKDRMRHASVQTTSRIYSHIYNKTKFDIADRLSDLDKK